MLKKSIMVLSLVTVAGTGLSYAKSQVEQKVSEQVLEVVESDEIMNTLKNKELEQQLLTNINLEETQPQADDRNSILSPAKEAALGSIDSSIMPAQSEKKIAALSKEDKIAIAKLAEKNNVKTPVDAVKYVERKIPLSEKVEYIQLYNNRENLTQEQKQAVKEEVLSHFTAEELAMLVQAVQK